MRQSQHKLRLRKAERFNSLESEIDSLKVKNAELEKEIAALVACETVGQQYTLTNVDLKKMIDVYSPNVGETILLSDFIIRNNINGKRLYQDDEFILEKICKKMVNCLEVFISDKEVRPIATHSFKYLEMYGRSLPSIHYSQIKAVVEKRIPTSWLKGTYLPRNTLGVSDVLIYLNMHLEPDHTNFQVLTFALARYICGTPFGPVITKEHLVKAIELSYNPKLDLFFLRGTLNVQLCDVPEALIDSLVR